MKGYKRIIIFTGCFLLLYCFGFTGGYFYIRNTQKVQGKQTETYETKNVSAIAKGVVESKDSNDEKENMSAMVNKKEKSGKTKSKIAYLTFDDGPSTDVTPEILDILGENDIKATFFLIGKNAEENKDLVKKEFKLGHAIGSHTYSHNLNMLYKDMDLFKSEVEKGFNSIKSALGEDYDSDLFRFPGGSFENSKEPFKKYIKGLGKKYYDWNCLNGDAEGHGFTKERLFNRFKETFGGEDRIIILMHDTQGKKTTPEALQSIIDYLKDKGYSFETLKDY